MKIAEIKGIFNSKFSTTAIISSVLARYMKLSIMKAEDMAISEPLYKKKVKKQWNESYPKLIKLYNKKTPIAYDRTDNYTYFIFHDINDITAVNNDISLNIIVIYESGTVDKTIKDLYKRINKIIGINLKFTISQNVPCKLYNCRKDEVDIYDKNYFIHFSFNNSINKELLYPQVCKTIIFFCLTILSYVVFKNQVDKYIYAFNTNSTLEVSIATALFTNLFCGFLCTFVMESLWLLGIFIKEICSENIRLSTDPDIVVDNFNSVLPKNTFSTVGDRLENNTLTIPEV